MRRSGRFYNVFAITAFSGVAFLSACSILSGGDDSSAAAGDGGGDETSSGRRDSGTSKKDSGTSGSSDAGLRHDDAGHVILPDGGTLVCEPGPLGSFSGGTYEPPVGPYANVCTATDFTNYISCISGSDTGQCAQFESGGARVACGACLLTPSSATHWGATVGSDPATSTLNIPGCLALAFGEGSSTTGCGGSLQKSFNCQDIACDPTLNCAGATTDEMSTCDNDAIAGECSTYSSAADTACTKDGGGLENNCSVSDSTSAMNYLNFFCGTNGG